MRKVIRTCERCGMQFYVDLNKQRVTTCPECPIIVRQDAAKNAARRTRGHLSYDMALELVTIRLAFEMIEPLLKMGRRKEAIEVYDETKRVLEERHLNATGMHPDTLKALEILEEVEAPARETSITISPDEEDPEIDLREIVLLEAESESRSRG